MKAGIHKITVQAHLTLSQRELQLLNHIASYDNGAAANMIAQGAVSSHYAGGVTKEEIQELFQRIRAETQVLMAEIEDAKTKLFHSRQ